MISQVAHRNQAWTSTTLGDLLTVIRGVTYKKEQASNKPASGLIPIIRANNIQNGLEFDDLVYVPKDCVSKDQMLNKGDIVVAASSGSIRVVGKAAALRSEWVGSFGAFCFGLRPKEGVEPAFLEWFLQTSEYRNRVSKLAAGVNINNLRAKHIEETPISLPAIDEQRTIVAEIEKQLTRLDAGLASLKRLQANLKCYRASVLKAACEGKLVPTDMTQWKRLELGDVLNKVEAGKSFRCEERPPTGSEVGVVKVSAVTWGTYDELESKTCLDPNRVEERFLIQPGDFLFSRANTIELIGACVIAQNVSLRVMLSDKILRLKFAKDILPQWALYWLRSEYGRREIERLATGNQNSMRNIGQDRIRQISILLPPLVEQKRIVEEVERRLSVAEQGSEAVTTNIRRARSLRQAVLQGAFRTF